MAANWIRIGTFATSTGTIASDQSQNSIIINSTSNWHSADEGSILIDSSGGPNSLSNIQIAAHYFTLPTDASNSLFIKPVRQEGQTNALYYNQSTGEITYDLSGGGGGGGGGTGYTGHTGPAGSVGGGISQTITDISGTIDTSGSPTAASAVNIFAGGVDVIPPANVAFFELFKVKVVLRLLLAPV